MKPASKPTLNNSTVDGDLAEQAKPGHGIPSQDTNPAAQMPMQAGEAAREADSVLAGGGVVVGAAAGAAIGTLLGGPVGAVVAGTAGAVAGALGSAPAARLLKSKD
jgi:outer membrane lipoprotein SlyB